MKVILSRHQCVQLIAKSSDFMKHIDMEDKYIFPNRKWSII